MNEVSRLAFSRKISVSALELLLRSPYWRAAVLEAHQLPPLPINYQPIVVEFFDQQGLLVSKVNDAVFTVSLPLEHHSAFTAIYFDGELVVFTVGKEVVINRLTLVTVFALFDLGGEE